MSIRTTSHNQPWSRLNFTKSKAVTGCAAWIIIPSIITNCYYCSTILHNPSIWFSRCPCPESILFSQNLTSTIVDQISFIFIIIPTSPVLDYKRECNILGYLFTSCMLGQDWLSEESWMKTFYEGKNNFTSICWYMLNYCVRVTTQSFTSLEVHEKGYSGNQIKLRVKELSLTVPKMGESSMWQCPL